MKLVIFAHQNWGVECIKELIHKHEILYVFTHPLDMDRHEKVWYSSVKEECISLNIPVEEKINASDIDTTKIKQLNPDLILSLGWRRLLPNSIFEIPKHGTINLHDSLIPNYRGFAPINWAIINGEKEVGITTHYIDEGIDTGKIILQKKIIVNLDDTAYDVYKNLLAFSPKLILDTLEMIEQGNISLSIENNTKGFFCSRRFPDDGKINWKDDRINVYNLIRALCDPYPNAFCFYKGNKVLIKKSKLINDDFRGMPGKICSITDTGIIVTCGNDHTKNQAILITVIQSNGKLYKANEFIFKLWDLLE